jgi:large subunit ribosomal protein L3
MILDLPLILETRRNHALEHASIHLLSHKNPGKRMAGHMGDVQCTTQNVEVVRIDEERGLILLKGAIPGPKGGWVEIRDAVRTAAPKDLPMPAAVKAKAGA